VVDYTGISITPNTRASFPLEFIEGVKIPAIGGHPSNIIFLTCDAFGVLPPISRLTNKQAMYHFITGYTAKVAGTEQLKEGEKAGPKADFSACFGAPFLPLHPVKYANMLEKKLKEHNTKVWLVNTGWTGNKALKKGGYRIPLKYSRAIMDAIHANQLDDVDYWKMPIMNI